MIDNQPGNYAPHLEDDEVQPVLSKAAAAKAASAVADAYPSLVDFSKDDAEKDPDKLTKPTRRRAVVAFNRTIAILDRSERDVRDAIESGLMNVDHQDADKETKAVMKQITVIRTRAFKAAFKAVATNMTDTPGRTWARQAAFILKRDLFRIDNAIKSGLTEGLDNTEIARKVIGSAGNNGADGVTEVTRKQILRLGRTSLRGTK